MADRQPSLHVGEAVLMAGSLVMLVASGAIGLRLGVGSPTSSATLHLHVHAGALGWMTLGVLGVASVMVGWPTDADGTRRGWPGVLLSILTVAAVTWFVVEDGLGAGLVAWSGAAALAAIVADVVWLAARWGRSGRVLTEPVLGMAAALILLVAGTALGAGAAGNVGATGELGSTHAVVLSFPFVLLAATSIVEWSVDARLVGTSHELGTVELVQVGLLVLGAAALFAGFAANNLALTEANVPLQVGGIAIFLWRVGRRLFDTSWYRAGRSWLATCCVLLAAEAGLFAHVVFEIARQRYVSINLVPPWLLFVLDHLTFVGIGTAALFGALAAMTEGAPDPGQWSDAPAASGVVLGIGLTAAGISMASQVAEAVGASLLGLSLLVAAVAAAVRVAHLWAADGWLTLSGSA